MRKKGFFLFSQALPLAFYGLLAFSAPARSADEMRQETRRGFHLAQGGIVRLENTIGRVRVQAWDYDSVSVLATKKLDREFLKASGSSPDETVLERIKIDFKSDSSLLEIETRIQNMDLDAKGSGFISACKMVFELFKGDCNRLPLQVEYELRVPKRCEIRVLCDIGEVAVEGVDGRLDLKSDIGRIETRNTSGGQRARLSVGQITIRGAKGSVDAKSELGRVEAYFDSLGVDDRVFLESEMGEVNLFLPSWADIDLDAESELGSVTSSFKDNFDGSSEWNSLRGKINRGGGARVTLKTGLGGIEIASKPE